MKIMIALAILVGILLSCNDNASTSTEKKAPAVANSTVSQEREHPSTKAAATFSQNINTDMGKLNNWKFAVALYETSKTFLYRMQIQYAELNVTDSLYLPDLGVAPQPRLQKGKEDYSCIIGFMDNKGVFRDYKLVSAKEGKLRIHALKYYSVQRTTKTQ